MNPDNEINWGRSKQMQAQRLAGWGPMADTCHSLQVTHKVDKDPLLLLTPSLLFFWSCNYLLFASSAGKGRKSRTYLKVLIQLLLSGDLSTRTQKVTQELHGGMSMKPEPLPTANTTNALGKHLGRSRHKARNVSLWEGWAERLQLGQSGDLLQH